MLKIKSGPGAARIHSLQPPMILAAIIAERIFDKYGYDAVITSGIDGKHMPGSLHYVGFAFDLRSNIIPKDQQEPVRADLKSCLGDDYDVVVEGDHYHVEFQPKKPYGE